MKLGQLILQDFEIPQYLRFGGRHKVAIRQFADGKRLVERLGPDDSEITFSGVFSGLGAEARVRAFDNLRLSGDIVWLTWESFKRRVIVRSLSCTYKSPWWIPYQISCVVAVQHRVSVSQATTAAALASTDLAYALAAAAGTSLSLSSLQSSLSLGATLVQGSQTQTTALTAVQAALLELDTQVDQQSKLVNTPVVTSAGPSSVAQSFCLNVVAAGSLAATTATRSYVSRIGVTLSGQDL